MVVGGRLVAAHTLYFVHGVEFHYLELALYPALATITPTRILPPRLSLIILYPFHLKKLLLIIIPQNFLLLLLYPLSLQHFGLIQLR